MSESWNLSNVWLIGPFILGLAPAKTIILLCNSALLTEAGQTVPDFLVELESEQPELLTAGGDKGCTFCGGLGHRITECPKLESAQRVKANNKKDYIPSGAQDY